VFQVRIHGRGGQGVVSAAEMLSIAAFLEGRWAQAFPSFGSERMGAPVMAFCRMSDREIRLREPVTEPDASIVQDPTLLNQISCFDGLSRNGYVLINSTRAVEDLGIDRVLRDLPMSHCRTVPATDLALQYIGRPVPNAAMLGAFCAVTGHISLESLEAAIRKKFSGPVGENNVKAARAAFAIAAKSVGAARDARGVADTNRADVKKTRESHAEAG
jgi:pyruvate ferredoxin oxidoreductase gamma subunit